MTTTTLPPDPDGQNDDRAAWADTALRAFARTTKMDTANEADEDILADLLCDLMHWCDRCGIAFEQAVLDATVHYVEETRQP